MSLSLSSLLLAYVLPTIQADFGVGPTGSLDSYTPVQQAWIHQAPNPDTVLRDGHFGGIQPLHYRLQIRAPISDQNAPGIGLSFTGSLKFRFKTVQETNLIFLHSKDLSVKLADVHLFRAEGRREKIPLLQKLTVPERQIIIFKPYQGLDSFRDFEMSFPEFQGTIKPGYNMGIFTGFVHQSTTQSLFVTATQFQLHSARTAFPCIDMPNFKAKLTLTLTHPPNTEGLGNMETLHTTNTTDQWLSTTFRPTPLLPTYTMGFVILPNAYIRLTDKSNGGTAIRLLYNPYRLSSTLAQKLLEYAKYSLSYYEQQFREALPLRKIDFVVTPQFAVQGMENFGLITLNQDYLIRTKPAYRLSLITHEIVHQWISNLVTVKGWDHVCFQEGITDHFARKVVQRYFKVSGTKLPYIFAKFYYENSMENYLDAQKKTLQNQSAQAKTAHKTNLILRNNQHLCFYCNNKNMTNTTVYWQCCLMVYLYTNRRKVCLSVCLFVRSIFPQP